MKKERNIFMTTPSDSSTSIKVLKETIAWFKKQIEPHDCGWMYTTIDGLNHRIKILKKEIHDQRAEEIAAYVFKEKNEK
jgi:hypothetical protein